MPIHSISGKPGGGKSRYGATLIEKELVYGNRLVVTNLPIKLGRMNEYLQERYPDRDIPLAGPGRRLVLLDATDPARALYQEYSRRYYAEKNVEQQEAIYAEFESKIKALKIPEEARHFWEYRNPTKRRFSADKGTLFVLDEVHIHFNARKWAETADACLHYLSQHRKFNDVVVYITQAVSNVDKQFRSVTEDFTVVRNEYMAKYGPFRGRGRFVRKTYLSEPQGGNKQEPFEVASFTIDAQGIASCYDTAAGVGVHGNAADKGSRAKGFSIWWTIPIAAAVCAAVVAIPHLAGKVVAKGLDKAEHVPSPVSRFLPQSKPTGDPPPMGQATSNQKPEKWVIGVLGSRARKRLTVYFSDGTTATELDAALGAIERNRVLYGGKWFPIRAAEGSGAKVAPVRPDGVPPVVALARNSGGTTAQGVGPSENSPLPPSTDSESSWVMGSDGVNRLRNPEHLPDVAQSSVNFQRAPASRRR